MTDVAAVDYFFDQAVAQNPYDYFEYLRSQHPVFREPHHGVVAVTGYPEVIAALKNPDVFSACNSIGGPFPPLPFEPVGDDISAQIEAHRHEFPIFEHLVTMDPPAHDRARSLLSKMLTPKRLKENEEFMWQLVDRQFDEFISNGECEFLTEYAKPFATLVIADLLGVPEETVMSFERSWQRKPTKLARWMVNRWGSIRSGGSTISSAATSPIDDAIRAAMC